MISQKANKELAEIVKAKLKADEIDWKTASNDEIKKALEFVAIPTKCYEAINSARIYEKELSG